MEATNELSPSAVLPANDEAIAQALAELDGKLATWLAALHDARLLVAMAQVPTPAAALREPALAEPAALVADAPNEMEPPPATVAEEPAAAVMTEPRLASVAPAEASETDEEPAAKTTTRGRSKRRGKSRPDETPQPEAGPASEPQPPQPPPAQPVAPPPAASAADDEALLASLDEEVARAIRVKRRLTDNKRSVRELLEEMQSARAKPGESQRKSWWR